MKEWAEKKQRDSKNETRGISRRRDGVKAGAMEDTAVEAERETERQDHRLAEIISH